jgi:RNA polymerase II-associated factor 1
VRVRYANPLPAPPCPPKLLDIPTDPLRYARPEFLDALAGDAPLPMIVDAEMGMPLDLSRWESLWEEGADDSGARALAFLFSFLVADDRPWWR